MTLMQTQNYRKLKELPNYVKYKQIDFLSELKDILDTILKK